jgi:hypothetical protein
MGTPKLFTDLFLRRYILHIEVLWTRIETNADPDPAFYIKKRGYRSGPGSQTNADPYPRQT